MKTDDKALEKETQELKWTRKAVKIRDIEFIMKLLESDRHINRGSVYCLTKSGLNKLSMEDLGNLRFMISVAFRSVRDAERASSIKIIYGMMKIGLNEPDEVTNKNVAHNNILRSVATTIEGKEGKDAK